MYQYSDLQTIQKDSNRICYNRGFATLHFHSNLTAGTACIKIFILLRELEREVDNSVYEKETVWLVFFRKSVVNIWGSKDGNCMYVFFEKKLQQGV